MIIVISRVMMSMIKVVAVVIVVVVEIVVVYCFRPYSRVIDN